MSAIFGFSTHIESLEKNILYAHEHGLGHIEILFSKTDDPAGLFTKDRAAVINDLSHSKNVSLSLHVPYSVNISDNIPYLRNQSIRFLRQSIETFGWLNVTHITIHIGTFYWFPNERVMRRNALKRFARQIPAILAFCGERNISLALENVVPIPYGSDFFYLGDRIEDFKFLLETFPSDLLGFCLDTGHANIGEGVGTYINALHHKILAVHFHDNLGHDDNHMIIGRGTVDWKSLADFIKTVSRPVPVISECRGIQPHEAVNILKGFMNAPSPT